MRIIHQGCVLFVENCHSDQVTVIEDGNHNLLCSVSYGINYEIEYKNALDAAAETVKKRQLENLGAEEDDLHAREYTNIWVPDTTDQHPAPCSEENEVKAACFILRKQCTSCGNVFIEREITEEEFDNYSVDCEVSVENNQDIITLYGCCEPCEATLDEEDEDDIS